MSAPIVPASEAAARLQVPCMQNVSHAFAGPYTGYKNEFNRGWSQQHEDALFEQFFLSERRSEGKSPGIYVELGVRFSRRPLGHPLVLSGIWIGSHPHRPTTAERRATRANSTRPAAGAVCSWRHHRRCANGLRRIDRAMW